MANNNTQTVTLRGKASFAKILGDPVLNYNKDGKEWKMDLEISTDTAKETKQYGIADRVKKKDGYLDGKPFLSFKQAEFKRDDTPNKKIEVVDILGKPWDDNTLIGNGSDVDVKFAIVDYGVGKKKGVYIRKVRVLKLIPYGGKAFEEIDENDEFYQAALEAQAKADHDGFKEDFGLDDPVDDIGDEDEPV